MRKESAETKVVRGRLVEARTGGGVDTVGCALGGRCKGSS